MEDDVVKFEVIFKHFDKWFIGEKYKKYENIEDEDERSKYKDMYNSGSEALSEFKKIGTYFENKGYIYRKKLPAWAKQSQEMNNYFWLELKNKLYESLPSSISIFAIKEGLRIVVEIKSNESKEEDLKRHNKYITEVLKLNIDEINKYEYWYSKGKSDDAQRITNKDEVKTIANKVISGEYHKLQIGYFLQRNIVEEKSNNNVLEKLNEYVQLLNSYYIIACTTNSNNTTNIKDDVEENSQMICYLDEINADDIEFIKCIITQNGFQYDVNILKNLAISLKTKPFVILSGISGTGKSKLVKLFAEALGSTTSNSRFTLIPVRPDWSDSSDLLGYRNLNGRFHPGLLTSVIEKAMKDKTHLYFVCLDEMNLARVEYYLSDILSIIESRYTDKNGEIKTDKLIRKELLGKDEEAINKYSDLYIPENLYIIGTVNMDETTFPFSKKVLDRANTIEFNEVNLAFDFDTFDADKVEGKVFTNSFLKPKYIKLIDCKEDKELATDIINELIEINNILEKYNQHFAYRVRDEIVYYCLYALKDKLFIKEQALDYCIVQKILPKICGSDEDTAELLKDLYNHLNNTKYAVSDFEDSKFQQGNLYKLSNKKIIAMIRRFVRDGFTNFWQ